MATSKKAIPKRVNPRKGISQTNKKSIEDVIIGKLEKADYENIEVLFDDSCFTIEWNEEDGDNFEIEFSFAHDELPYCCGVIELGEFTYNEEGELDGTEISEDNVVVLLSKSIKEAVENQDGRLVIFTVNEERKSDIFEKAALKTGLFKLVKEFENPAGHSILRTYATK